MASRPPQPSPSFPYKSLHVPRPYYHMLPEDVRIWERFLQRHEEAFPQYYYDVLCGPRVDLSNLDLEPSMAALAERLLCLRLDVMAIRQGEVWIFEVKPNAGLSALGQLLAYEFYMRDRLRRLGRVALAVVTDYLRHYMRPIFDHYNIWTILIHDEEEKPTEVYAPRAEASLPPPVETEGGVYAYVKEQG